MNQIYRKMFLAIECRNDNLYFYEFIKYIWGTVFIFYLNRELAPPDKKYGYCSNMT